MVAACLHANCAENSPPSPFRWAANSPLRQRPGLQFLPRRNVCLDWKSGHHFPSCCLHQVSRQETHMTYVYTMYTCIQCVQYYIYIIIWHVYACNCVYIYYNKYIYIHKLSPWQCNFGKNIHAMPPRSEVFGPTGKHIAHMLLFSFSSRTRKKYLSQGQLNDV